MALYNTNFIISTYNIILAGIGENISFTGLTGLKDDVIVNGRLGLAGLMGISRPFKYLNLTVILFIFPFPLTCFLFL